MNPWLEFAKQVLIGFVVTMSVIVVAYLVSKHIIEKAVRLFLESLGIDDIAKELEISKALGRYKLSEILAIAARWYAFFYILTAAAGVFNLQALIPVLGMLLSFVGNVIAAALILLIFYLAGYYIKTKAQESDSPSLAMLGEGGYLVILFIGIVSALKQLNLQGIDLIYQIITIAVAAFFVSLSIAFGVALGLALKDKAAKELEKLLENK